MPGQGEPTHSPRRIVNAERQAQALQLRRAGAAYDEIARQLGYTKMGAWKAVASALKKTLQEPADDVRKLELERLDRLLLAIWNRAIQGDDDAIDRVLKITDRRAALLGLNVNKFAMTNSQGNDEPITDGQARVYVEVLFARLGIAMSPALVNGETNGHGHALGQAGPGDDGGRPDS